MGKVPLRVGVGSAVVRIMRPHAPRAPTKEALPRRARAKASRTKVASRAKATARPARVARLAVERDPRTGAGTAAGHTTRISALRVLDAASRPMR